MESQTVMEEDNAKSDVPRVKASDGSQNAGSCGLTSPAHSPEHINQQADDSEADIPARLPAVTTPVITLQACLDDTVSGISVPRNKMLDAISHVTIAIDKMKREHVITQLATLNLDTNGTKKILRKRLKRYYNHLRIVQYHLMLPYSERMQLDYLVVIDFEATCDEYNANVVQEIIEFPAVLVDVRNQTIAQVDRAKDFTDVLRDFEDWLLMLNLGTDKFAVVTDGHWDMSQLFKFQLELTGIALPCWAEQWVSIRKVYRAFYDSGYVNLLKMLNKSGMEFRCRRHCGLDDAINIAAIAIKLLHDGCIFTCNEYLCSYDSNIHLGVPEPNKAPPFSTLLTEVASHNLDSETVEHSDVLEQTWGNLFMPGPFGYLPHDSWATHNYQLKH